MGKYFRRMSVFKFVVFIIISIVVSVIFPGILMSIFKLNPLDLSNNGGIIIFLASLGMYLTMMILFYFIGLSELERSAMFMKAPSRSVPNFLYYFSPFALGILLNLIYINIISRLFPAFYKTMMESGNLSSNILKSKDPIQVVLVFIAVVIFAPIVEEIVFRGVLFNMLNKTMGLFAAAIVSSAAFGILHGFTFIQTFFIGLILAMLYQITGDIKVPIIAHAVNNLIAMFESILIGFGIVVEGGNSEIVYTSIILILSVLTLIGVVIYLKRNSLKKIFKDIAPIYKTEYFRTDEEISEKMAEVK